MFYTPLSVYLSFLDSILQLLLFVVPFWRRSGFRSAVFFFSFFSKLKFGVRLLGWGFRFLFVVWGR